MLLGSTESVLFQLSTVSAAFCFPLSHKLLLCCCLSSSDIESNQLWNHIKPRHLQMILCHFFFLEDLIIMWEIYKKGFPIKWKEFQSISPPPSSAQHGTSESDIDSSNSPSCNNHSCRPKIQQCGQDFLNWEGLSRNFIQEGLEPGSVVSLAMFAFNGDH